MFLKRILPIVIVLIAGLFYLFQKSDSCIGDTNTAYQNGWQGSFEVKVERKPETCGWVAGAYYTFSSHQGNSENWHEIMTIHHDDPIDIPNKAIHIIDERTAFVFMNSKLAVTHDNGRNWNVWDATNLPNWKFSDFGYIQNVTLTSDGNGILELSPLSSKNTSIPQFKTNDFGKNWNRSN